MPEIIPPPRTTRWTWVRTHRRSVFEAILLIILVVLLVSTCRQTAPNAFYGPSVSPTSSGPATTSAPATSLPPSPTQSVSPPAVVPPSGTPAPTDCVVPSEKTYKLSVDQVQPASNTDWMSHLKDTGATRIAYNGEFADAATMNNWINAAACDGFLVEIRADNLFDRHMSDSDTNAYLQDLSRHANLIDWQVRSGPQHDQRQATIRSAQTKPVYTLDDYPNSANGHPIINLFFPFPEPNQYGTVSEYTQVGQAAVKQDGSDAWAAVQAFDWSKSEPDVAAKFGIRPGIPAPTDVKGYAKLLHDQGVHNIMVYTEEPAADNWSYIADCIRQVASVLSQ